MNSLNEYFSDENIILQLCKERCKLARQRHERSYVPRLAGASLRQPQPAPVDSLLPPRAQWSAFRPRFRHTNRDTNFRTLGVATQTLRTANPNFAWVIRLQEFINELRGRALEQNGFRFASPRIFWELKKEHTYRPISKFDLMDGIICSLLARYLTDFFDVAFGSNSYAFRARRRDGLMPTRDTAINALFELRRSAPGQNLFVAECDIRAFFDSVEHGIATKAFEKTVLHVQGIHPDRTMAPRARVLFQAYLDCYNFPDNVLGDALSRLQAEDSQGRFPWPQQELQRLWRRNPRSLQIGVPQGGAISGVIANLVLNRADERVESLQQSANGDLRYFRYCDDTLFVSTNRDHCRRGLNAYLDALAEIKLPVHRPESIWIYRKVFWQQKSKSPYCWHGRKWFGCVPWVQFIGYQMRYDGLMRVRKESVVKQKQRLREIVDEAKWGLLRHVRDGHPIDRSKTQVTASVTRRLISAGVGHARKHQPPVPMPQCWSFGFQALQGKPIATRAFKELDRVREQQSRRMEQASITYGSNSVGLGRTRKHRSAVGFQASYFAQFLNQGGDDLINHPYRPQSSWERLVTQPVFQLFRNSLQMAEAAVKRLKVLPQCLGRILKMHF